MGVRERMARAREARTRDAEIGQRYSDLGVLLGKRTTRQGPRGSGLLTAYNPLDDVMVLAGREVKRWGIMDRALRELGDPLALSGGFAGLSYKPLSDALAGVAVAVANTAMWTATTYTPVFSATDPERAPMHYFNYWGATIAFGGTLTTITPNLALATAVGTNLGSGVATGNTPTSATGYMTHRTELSIRGTGSGTDARAIAAGRFEGKLTTSGVGAVDTNQIYGLTALTFDSTAANGLWLGISASAAFGTITTQQLLWASWN